MQVRSLALLALGSAASALASPLIEVERLVARQDSEAPPVINIPSPKNHTADVDSCRGYRAENVTETDTGLDATLQLIGDACNAYGVDYPTLKLAVRYETADRVRVQIVDSEGKAHQVNNTRGPWPALDAAAPVNKSEAALQFVYQADPFTFQIVRSATNESIFDTSNSSLIFEDQYVRLQTALPEGTNLYGLGEHNDNLSLPITDANYSRTLWNRDAFGLPTSTNLYSSHPVYFEHRLPSNASSSSENASSSSENATVASSGVSESQNATAASHAVFLLNSHGMDIKFPNGGRALEYNILGGVLDFSFFAGPSPQAVSQQYTEVIGRPVETPFWALGLHQCRYGYRDAIEIAEVVNNYTAAGIPLQTMFIDIDYMQSRIIMTLDEGRYFLNNTKNIIDTMKARGQDFIMMVDPAVSTNQSTSYDTGAEQNVFLRRADDPSQEVIGVVWPGPTVFPDWSHPNASSWWTTLITDFFAPDRLNVSGLWLDMNEPASFLPYVNANPGRISLERELPPARPPVRPVPEGLAPFNLTNPVNYTAGENDVVMGRRAAEASASFSFPWLFSRQNANASEPANLADNETDATLDSALLYPPYRIQDRRASPSQADASSAANNLKNISDFTVRTDTKHYNGETEYETHNLYGHDMSIRTREALLERIPGQKTFMITRSTFAGSGHSVQKWLGDSLSDWPTYIATIRQVAAFSAFYGISMVGPDTCGFGGNTTESLCARWAALGAFTPFFRNHNDIAAISQEFYRWPVVAESARKNIAMRYKLLDYFYSALHVASVNGTPAAPPMFFNHPSDQNTFKIETQYYYGPSLLVSPVVEENATSVEIYVPQAQYYNLTDLSPVQGNGTNVTLTDIPLTDIPVHILGGSILPMRSEAGNTTVVVRQQNFTVVVAPDAEDSAKGFLRLDDGITLNSTASDIYMTYQNGTLDVTGTFEYTDLGSVVIDRVIFLNQDSERNVTLGENSIAGVYNETVKTLTVASVSIPLTAPFTASIANATA